MQTLTRDELRGELAQLEVPRRQLHHSTGPQFDVVDGSIAITLPEDPADEESPRETYKVTKELWEAITKDLGAGTTYFRKTPAKMLLPQLNWWYGDPEASKPSTFVLWREARNGDRLGINLLPAAKYPVEGTRVLEVVDSTLQDLTGTAPVFPFYQRNGMESVLIAAVTDDVRYEVRHRQVGDVLRGGVSVLFSPLGKVAPQVTNYVDRLICTNGMVTRHGLDRWTSPGGDGAQDPYEWLPNALREAHAQLEARFEEAQHMADTPVDEADVETVVTDLFDHFGTPAGLRSATLRQLVNTNVESFWDVANAMTFAATHDERISDPRHRLRLMMTAGDAAAVTERCDRCRHLLIRHAHENRN